uniref:G-protein coupled receptors family 1 profile domain-containing protein n=1 Tax=Cavia porcellus TaxID=10141 RepID=A0A286XQ04_CAVPO
TSSEDVEMKNATLLTQCVLTGLPHHLEWRIPLFLAFLAIYLITLVGNLGLITLIRKEPHLHTPMYFFLGNLAFVDTWLSSTVTPKYTYKMMYFPCNHKMFLLAAIACDRYVAICKPLLFPLLVLSFVGGFLHALVHESFIFRSTFCNSNIIHHFYCDVIPLTKISCTDPAINYLMVFIFSGSIQIFSIVTIFVSYTFVLLTVLKKKSEKGASNPFSTCGAHLFSVSLYYGPLLFMYEHPTSSQADDKDMIVSLFYSIINPVLNPFIYSLRNRQVMESLRKLFKRNV